MKIYLTRHSKTIWNQEKRLQGRKDSPLTQEGIENALALKKYIENIHFDYIYASPIHRAYKTASLLFDELDIIQDERLVEMDFGIFEGQKISDIYKTDFELYDNLWNHPEIFTRIPKGESYDEVEQRAQSFLHDLINKNGNVIIVTHGMFFIVLLAAMLKIPREKYTQLNQQVVEGCSLTCLEYENNQFKLISYNDYSYLPHISRISFQK